MNESPVPARERELARFRKCAVGACLGLLAYLPGVAIMVLPDEVETGRSGSVLVRRAVRACGTPRIPSE